MPKNARNGKITLTLIELLRTFVTYEGIHPRIAILTYLFLIYANPFSTVITIRRYKKLGNSITSSLRR